ncbi:unnamed protein product [Durusdinium trenchii]|uniref:Pseudouridine synthase RsuA/RluA-like domain-containing protein n=1 Tax=Durusdinium trenchii TaxID=1381693 RepID=A0ABP0IDD2_9DINO
MQELANIAWCFSTSAASDRPLWHILAEVAAHKISSKEAAVSLVDLESIVAATSEMGGSGNVIFDQLYDVAAQALEVRALALDGDAEKEAPSPILQKEPLGDMPAVVMSRGGLCALWKPPGWSVNVWRDDFHGLGGGPLGDTEGQGDKGKDQGDQEPEAKELQSWLMKSFGNKYKISLDPAVSHGLLHRLDRMTSGVIIWASSYHSYFKGRLQLATRKGLRKEYMCLSHGLMPRSPRIIDLPLQELPDGSAVQRTRVTDGPGKASATCLEEISHFQGPRRFLSLVTLELHTGRQHQIRAHLSDDGHPLLGDVDYGGDPPASGGAPRVCLHSSGIRLDREEPLEARLPWPEDLKPVVEQLMPVDVISRVALRKACSKEQIEKQVSDHETVVIRVWLMLRLS